MAKTRIGSNAIFTGASDTLVIVADYCYAYSLAKIFDNDPEVTLLSFNTGKHILKVQFLPYRTDTDSLNSAHNVYINGVLVLNMVMSSGDNHSALSLSPYQLIIPPLSFVEVKIVNISNTSNGTGACSMIGRVYE